MAYGASRNLDALFTLHTWPGGGGVLRPGFWLPGGEFCKPSGAPEPPVHVCNGAAKPNGLYIELTTANIPSLVGSFVFMLMLNSNLSVWMFHWIPGARSLGR